jgi:hypothetical protein
MIKPLTKDGAERITLEAVPGGNDHGNPAGQRQQIFTWTLPDAGNVC